MQKNTGKKQQKKVNKKMKRTESKSIVTDC